MANRASILELVEQSLARGDVELPVMDSVATKINKEVNEGGMAVDDLYRLIEKDPVLVNDILRVANSSFYVGQVEIKNLRDALVRLGVNQIASLALSSAQKRLYSSSSRQFRARYLHLWQHASAVSVTSRWLAKKCGCNEIAEDMFVAGILHDIGKLSLLRIVEDVVDQHSLETDNQQIEQIFKTFNSKHGVTLLESWNMPEVFRNVVLHIDEETCSTDDTAISIVRLADRICIDAGIGGAVKVEEQPGDMPEFESLGLSEQDLTDLYELLADFQSL